jgi:hypothetical protein
VSFRERSRDFLVKAEPARLLIHAVEINAERRTVHASPDPRVINRLGESTDGVLAAHQFLFRLNALKLIV